MRLDHVCDLDLGYRSDDFFPDSFVLVKPYGGEEGSRYGEGDGTATGDRVRGSVRWSNHPHRRSDGTMLPNAHGVIHTEDGADIARYRWLNDTLCVAEGTIDTNTLRMHIRVYSCSNELL